MPPMPMFDGKNCTKCLRWKPYGEFHRDRRNADGRQGACKLCVKAYQQQLLANPVARRPASRDEKRCPRCTLTKPAAEFGLRRGGKYLTSLCRMCATEKATEFLRANPEKRRTLNRRTTLRRYYGMTPEDYDALFLAQGGVCAVCGSPQPVGRKKYLSVDHDHVSGAVRGLLCARCNTAVGFLRDDPVRTNRLLDYLRTHSERPPDALRHFATPHARR